MTLRNESRRHVCVLLSTFNGANYLRAQLDSLLAQQEVKVTVLVRDDGSNDTTLKILREYALTHSNVHVSAGRNLGVVGSYLELAKVADACDSMYFAFCDQDDIWLPEKLSQAIGQLTESVSLPQLYCSAVQYVDASLHEIGKSRVNQRPGFDNAIVENIAVGCTTVFNRAALELVNSVSPRHALMHDWWLYLVVSAFGRVVFDPQPHILYRQHGSNVVGGTTSAMRMALTRLRRFRLRREGIFRCSDQAGEFLRCFGERVSPGHRALVEEMLAVRGHFISRLRFALSGKVRRMHWIDNQLLRVLVTAGLY